MKVKLLDIVSAYQVLPGIASRKMPTKVSYAIGKNIRLVSQEHQDYDKARIKILEDNWKYNDELGKYDIPDAEQKKWHDLHNELLETEIDFEPYLIEFAQIEDVEITPGEFAALWFIFKEPISNPN